MTMPRRSSRAIEVDGAAFRWAVGRRPDCCAYCRGGVVAVHVESAHRGGSILTVDVPGEAADHLGVRPDGVRQAIRLALAGGWNPDLAGQGMRVPYPLS